MTRARVAAGSCVDADADGPVDDDEVVEMPRGVKRSRDAGACALRLCGEQGWL